MRRHGYIDLQGASASNHIRFETKFIVQYMKHGVHNVTMFKKPDFLTTKVLVERS